MSDTAGGRIFNVGIICKNSQLNFKDNDMAQGHKVGSSPAATKVKADKSSIEQNGKSKPKLAKRQISIICGIAAVLVIALIAILIFALTHNESQPDTQDNTETTQTEPEIDYDQKITSEDGGEFKAEYQQGSETDFTARFFNLKCEDNCQNVSEVKVGDKVLKQGEDYEVKSGSIIIILKGDFLDQLQAGKFDLIIAVKDGDTTNLYGVKFTIKPMPTCGEDEVLEKGECIKKPGEEQPSQTSTTTSSNHQSTNPNQSSPSSQPSAPSKSQAEIECENRQGPIGYTIILRPQSDNRYELPDWNMYWGMTGDNFFDNGATNMVWAGGGCHPHIKNVPATGSYSPLYTPEQLQQGKPDIYNMMVSHPNQDLVVWYWSYDRATYEFYSDGQSVMQY